MPAVLLDSQGRVLSNGTGCYVTDDVFVPPTYSGTVDRVGLAALGGDEEDIDGLQRHVWGDKEDNDYGKVTEANLAFGPNGSTPLTGANRATIKSNVDVRYFPKFDPSPSSNTSGANLFSGYYYLCAIPTHGGNTSKVTSFASVFYTCYNLHSVGDLSNGVTSLATTVSAMFQSCNNISYIGDLSGGNTSNVTTIANLFNGCYKLKGVGKLSNGNTAKCTNFSGTFASCYYLDDIGNLSTGNTASVTSFSSMFNTCLNLKRVEGLGTGNVQNVNNLSSMFVTCPSLTYIDNLTNGNTGKCTTFASMFSGCFSLKRIGNISNGNVSLATNMYNMFNGCYLLTDIGDLSNGNVSKVNGTSTSTGFIGMFSNCYSLKNIGDLSDGDLNLSGNNYLNSMFYNCRSLIHLSVSDGDVSSVLTFTSTFGGMCKLRELDLYNWDLSGNTNTGTTSSSSIFSYLYQLSKLTLGPKFFNSSTVTTYYFDHLSSGKLDSVVESLYTNQTLRTSSSPLITIRLNLNAFDRIKNNLPEGFTLTNTTTITINSKNINLIRV